MPTAVYRTLVLWTESVRASLLCRSVADPITKRFRRRDVRQQSSCVRLEQAFARARGA